ncbi:unnamed protein product [Cyclocybe aegerita]|uniref:Uncharacterized protein n=1 Tax=Cyclocybe aegerita TaxID=1973307 RepID=A0A8S0WFL4_CYCAE|nr:unnamed protein product [Cyclocybe aegerita]
MQTTTIRISRAGIHTNVDTASWPFIYLHRPHKHSFKNQAPYLFAPPPIAPPPSSEILINAIQPGSGGHLMSSIALNEGPREDEEAEEKSEEKHLSEGPPSFRDAVDSRVNTGTVAGLRSSEDAPGLENVEGGPDDDLRDNLSFLSDESEQEEKESGRLLWKTSNTTPQKPVSQLLSTPSFANFKKNALPSVNGSPLKKLPAPADDVDDDMPVYSCLGHPTLLNQPVKHRCDGKEDTPASNTVYASGIVTSSQQKIQELEVYLFLKECPERRVGRTDEDAMNSTEWVKALILKFHAQEAGGLRVAMEDPSTVLVLHQGM